LWKKITNLFHLNNTYHENPSSNSNAVATNDYQITMKTLLIIGLGNPGHKYNNTRHNAGFMFLDFLLARNQDTHFSKVKLGNVLVAQYFQGNTKVILAKPQDYMNASGSATQALIRFYKLSPETDIIIVHDDLDITFGHVKVSTNSGAAGQKGVADIIDTLSTKNFTRFRIGIESRNQEQKKHISGSDFVLGRFTDEQKSELESVFASLINKLEHFQENQK